MGSVFALALSTFRTLPYTHGMRIVPVPCLSDNYAYLVINERSAEAIVVMVESCQPLSR